MKKFLASILSAAMLLSLLPTAFAAGDPGLSAFADSKQYSDKTFTDVSASAWYAPSVETVYKKGIMDGTGGGKFAPESTISWAQAATIAARLHAAYHGKTIPAAEGAWYVQYLDYARENDLLPATCPQDAQADSAPIPREGLAVLFRSVLDEKDLPAVNDQSIPDLAEVRGEYRDTVSEMFASGIFTGTDGGRFSPNGQATRAQVATIVARLLCPGQRVSQDAKQNPNMADQMGNLYTGGIAAEIGDTVYYLHHNDLRDQQGNYTEDWNIYARTGSGQVRKVHSGGGERMSLLSVGPDGLLYFAQNTQQSNANVLKRLDPKTGKAETVYTAPSGGRVDMYLFYDGQLYASVYTASGDSRIGRVDNGKLTALVTVPDWENLFIDDTLYGFNGKLCWLQLTPRDSKKDDHLMILDLKTGKTDAVVTTADNIAYQGATVWSMGWINNEKSVELKRFSLEQPEIVETVAVYTGEYTAIYPCLYANGSQLYFQVSNARKLWTISSSGQTEVAAIASTQYNEASAVTSQGILLLGIDAVDMLNSSGIDVLTTDGRQTNLSAFLHQPYCLENGEQLTATGDSIDFGELSAYQDDVYGKPLRAYTTAEGDLALEIQVVNCLDETFRPMDIMVELSGDAEGAACFSFNKKIPPKKDITITVVFPKGTVKREGPLSEINADTIVTGRWE